MFDIHEVNMRTKALAFAAVLIFLSSSLSHGETMKCPDKVFSESELADIIKAERAKRQDLPLVFSNYKARVIRLRCLYLYFEYPLPESRGIYQAFTIDPFGELMEFSRGQPQ